MISTFTIAYQDGLKYHWNLVSGSPWAKASEHIAGPM